MYFLSQNNAYNHMISVMSRYITMGLVYKNPSISLTQNDNIRQVRSGRRRR